MAEVPPWLNVMRAITGTAEVSGSGSNPKILAMADTIAEHYPEMTNYCAQYNDDAIAWCGLAVAYCTTMAGIRPPFGSTDTDRFLWAESFASDPGFERIDAPRLGCIMVKSRDGGNHVTLYESTIGSSYNCRGGNQSNAVNVQSYPAKDFFAMLWPKNGGAAVATVNRRVLDISHHNTVQSWQQIVDAGILGIIHKATEGATYVDDQYASRKEAAMEAGLLWGAYHWGNAGNVKAQVDHFLKTCGIHSYMLYALDWEDDPRNGTMSKAQAQEFMQRVDDRIGRNACVVYSGNTAKEAIGSVADPFFGAHRLWLAQYGSSPVVQKSWKTWWIWQYSDGNNGPSPHGCPGVSGDVDTNSWNNGTDEELIAQWSGAAKPEPAPPEPEPTPATITINIKVEGVAPENVHVNVHS